LFVTIEESHRQHAVATPEDAGDRLDSLRSSSRREDDLPARFEQAIADQKGLDRGEVMLVRGALNYNGVASNEEPFGDAQSQRSMDGIPCTSFGQITAVGT
jgi:hypothetical protein